MIKFYRLQNPTTAIIMASGSEAFPYAYLQWLEAPSNPTIGFDKIELYLPEITVGRGKENSFIIADLLISRKHATFRTNKNNGWLIESVGMNGTSVNDVLLSKSTPTPLKHLDKIQFGLGPGKFVFTFCLRSVDGSQCSFAIESRPSAKDSRVIFRSSVLQQTLVKEKHVKHGYITFYGDVYYNLLVEREEERLKKFPHKGRSPQLNHRKGLLKVLLLMSNILKLSPQTYHLAVHLLDIFMDHHEIDEKQLMLAASSCLLVSAKFGEVSMNIPRISRLQELNFPYDIYSDREYRIMELMILNFFRCDLNFATSLHFLEYFMTGDMISRSTEGLVPYHLNLDDFKRKVLGLADLALSEAEFVHFKSSKVAAACVATARFVFGLEPKWPQSMEVLTGYRYVDILPCVQLLRDLTQLGMVMGLVMQPALEYEVYVEPLKTETYWRNKAPPTSYNSARNKRRPILSKKGSKKKMYYRQV